MSLNSGLNNDIKLYTKTQCCHLKTLTQIQNDRFKMAPEIFNTSPNVVQVIIYKLQFSPKSVQRKLGKP